MTRLRESRFLEPLLDRYAYVPPMAICRVPELELLSQIPLVEPVLDHCCGDGFIASTAFPGVQFAAGIDISRKQLARAERSGVYRDVQWADAAKELPFPDGAFATVFNNSAIEHIPDLDGALREISRVLRPGGKFYLNVLNRRFFDRWPLSQKTKARYKEFQPFFHDLTREEWEKRFIDAGFQSPMFAEYFEDHVSRVFAGLDYAYSATYFRKDFALAPILVRLLPPPILRSMWRKRYGDLQWKAEAGNGSGFMITGTKA